MKKIVEFISENDEFIIDFVGFDDWTHFDKIISSVKSKIMPDNIKYRGITDMDGYFDKEGLRVEIEYISVAGNWIKFNGEKTKENLQKVREWAKIIFDSLLNE